MKRNALIALTAATAIVHTLGTHSVSAQDYVRVRVNAISTSTNQAGRLIHRFYGNRNIIADCAEEHGLTNLMELSLVYSRADDAVHVVSGTNSTVVCTPLSFGGNVAVSNPNGTKVERLAFVFVETNSVANGTLLATESNRYGPTNQLARSSLRGQLQFAVPGDGTNGPVIYKGVIIAGPGGHYWKGKGNK